ncbi:unnamed protein product [Dovyalis caffra]|uniref:BAH domain-containing protein n=1 Tax=Dovyalis caffra TaxID=77055 RepID=A0AAV1SPL5_9ROSI|nr:unnamed protein product [Dovyalis caffra]
MVEATKVESIEFKWGKKRGIGGKKKDVQFYESFCYDGVEYTLYDSVYMYKEGETEPYIGKLIKIWENAEKEKKVKVLWFFRPCEIFNYLGDEKTTENELFLASGDGVGNANVNDLEAIAGKCNVVCSSKDNRNPQPTDKELQEADFVFCRTFDVGNCRILDKIDEKIVGIEAKFLLNRVDNQNTSGVPKLDMNKKEVSENVVATDGTRSLARKEPSLGEKATSSSDVKFDEVTKINDRQVDNSGEMASSSSKAKRISDVKPSLVNQESSLGENSACNSGLGERTKDDKKETMPSDNITSRSKDDVGSSESKVDKVLFNQVLIEEKVKVAKDSGDLDDRPSKKAKLDDLTKASYDNKVKSVQKLRHDSKAVAQTTHAFEDKSKPKLTKDPHEINNGLSKEPKPDEKLARLANGMFPEASLRQPLKEGSKTNYQIQEVTRRPEALKVLASACFVVLDAKLLVKMRFNTYIFVIDMLTGQKQVPWEERMQTALEQGTVVLLQNLDPSYTSAVVEASGWQYCCCFLFPKKAVNLFGHLVINKLRIHMQREMKEAVSTSHCSQPNTLEYDMAMEWCLLQERSDQALRKLRQQQEQELRKLRATLKSK